MKGFFVCLLMAASFFLPAAAFAHGVEIFDVTGQAGVKTVRFMYSSGESMLFAAVKVYSPSAPEVTVQETMTDRDGYFSFVPFENGDWRLTVEDGMGHKGEISIAVADGAVSETAGAAGTSQSGKLPVPIAIALGLSLILNVFGFWYLTGKKLKKPEAAHAH
jgi:nickel transport protein